MRRSRVACDSHLSWHVTGHSSRQRSNRRARSYDRFHRMPCRRSRRVRNAPLAIHSRQTGPFLTGRRPSTISSRLRTQYGYIKHASIGVPAGCTATPDGVTQHGVTGMMSIRILYHLEVIGIDHHQRQRALRARPALECRLRRLQKRAPIGETGEVIVRHGSAYGWPCHDCPARRDRPASENACRRCHAHPDRSTRAGASRLRRPRAGRTGWVSHELNQPWRHP